MDLLTKAQKSPPHGIIVIVGGATYMMGKKGGQLCFAVVDLDELIPENHLLKTINRAINFDFLYNLTRPYYSDKGRPSIDPVCLIGSGAKILN